MTTWVPGAEGSGYGPDHLPFGWASWRGNPARAWIRIGSYAVDCARFLDKSSGATLREGVDIPPSEVPGIRERVQAWLAGPADLDALVSVEELQLNLPLPVALYADFYSGIHHAENVGRLFRPDQPPLLPNYRALPVGYTGTHCSVTVSGTPVTRPQGITKAGEVLSYGPTAELDFELEIGAWVTKPVSGTLRPEDAAEHILGINLLNDWSARDIQRFEYQPLGPFLGKSFQTSVAGWITPFAALAPFRTDGPEQAPTPIRHLADSAPLHFDLELEVALLGAGEAGEVVISRSNARYLYWTFGQQLAHWASGGSPAFVLPSGTLFGTGTISGPEEGSAGSLLELTQRGTQPIRLLSGAERTWLQTGDEVILRASAGSIRLAECRGTITE